MASDHEHAIIEAVRALTAKVERLSADVKERGELASAVEDLRAKLGAVGYHFT